MDVAVFVVTVRVEVSVVFGLVRPKLFLWLWRDSNDDGATK